MSTSLASGHAGVHGSNGVTFWLNGVERTLTDPDPQLLALDYIRYEAGLKGTKYGCGEGKHAVFLVCLAMPMLRLADGLPVPRR